MLLHACAPAFHETLALESIILMPDLVKSFCQAQHHISLVPVWVLKEGAGGGGIEAFTTFHSSHVGRKALPMLPTAGAQVLSYLVSLPHLSRASEWRQIRSRWTINPLPNTHWGSSKQVSQNVASPIAPSEMVQAFGMTRPMAWSDLWHGQTCTLAGRLS